MADDVNTNALSDEELMSHMDNLPEEEGVDGQNNEGDLVDNSGLDSSQEESNVEDDTKDGEDTNEDDANEEVADTEDADPETDETEDVDDEEESHGAEDDVDDKADTEEIAKADDAKETPDTDEVDYKKFYDEVTSEYKANGKMNPGFKKPEEFKRALSMAANYAQKTTAIKPHLGRIKMLQDVTDDQLNEMLDFHHGNTDVIKKALKDAKLDPMEIDIDEEVQYKANDYSVSEAEIEFSETVAELKTTEEFGRLQDVVSKGWDKTSSEAVLSDPALLRGLHEEIAMGRFDEIQNMIDRKKTLGMTNGMSDLAMYQEIAIEMEAKKQQAEVKTQAPKVEVTPEVKQAVKAEKKKAVIKTKKTSKVVKKYDPVNMSDDDFMKILEDGKQFE